MVDWKAYKEASRLRRGESRISGAGMLRKHGVDFKSSNGGAHLIVNHNGRRFDYWPGTGKWLDWANKTYHRGQDELLAAVLGGRSGSRTLAPAPRRSKRSQSRTSGTCDCGQAGSHRAQRHQQSDVWLCHTCYTRWLHPPLVVGAEAPFTPDGQEEYEQLDDEYMAIVGWE